MSEIGTVLFGINRIYTVDCGGEEIRCRLKGKVLQSEVREYNPLAPGDVVEVDREGQGLIVGRRERVNAFWRWNRKGRAVQTLAANLNGVVCVAAVRHPPFRPRFIDRVLAIARHERIPVCVVLNKSDLQVTALAEDRLASYSSIGVPVIRCSARTGLGLDAVVDWAAPGPCAVIGQSGVGKSSLLNALDPTLELSTGDLSRKYNRGTHVTNFARLIRMRGTAFVDTPGIREIDLFPLSPEEVAEAFDEISDAAVACEYAACTHIHEPGCAVRASVENGTIHADRYESYVRVLSDLELTRRIARQ